MILNTIVLILWVLFFCILGCFLSDVFKHHWRAPPSFLLYFFRGLRDKK